MMNNNNPLSGDNGVLNMLRSSPLYKDQVFRERVDKGDVDGAVARSQEIVLDEEFGLGMKLPAEVLPGAVSRLRNMVAAVSEDLSIQRARIEFS